MSARPQFSIRQLMTATAAVAFLLAEAIVFPNWLAVMIGVVVQSLAPVAAVAGAIYGRNESRAFAIGALVGWYSTLDVTRSFSPSNRDLRFFWTVIWSLSLAAGALSVQVRRRLISREVDDPSSQRDRQTEPASEPQS